MTIDAPTCLEIAEVERSARIGQDDDAAQRELRIPNVVQAVDRRPRR
jgi:hypothetical protein